MITIETFPSIREAEDFLVSRTQILASRRVRREDIGHLVHSIGGGKAQAIYTDDLLLLIAEYK